jgi:hypothetical protein
MTVFNDATNGAGYNSRFYAKTIAQALDCVDGHVTRKERRR